MNSYINIKNHGDTSHSEVHSSQSMVMNSGLTQQSSKHALTSDVLHNALGGSGKDFGSMNMDELLKNIWTSEERPIMAPNSDLGAANNANLQKPGSLTLPRTLSQKTVDEVWKDLVKENGGLKDVNFIKEPNLQQQEKQPALGEMTLEEFLGKAGVGLENARARTDGRRSDDGSSIVFEFKNHTNQNKGFHQQAAVTDQLIEVNNLQGVRPSQPLKPQKILPKQAASNFTSPLKLLKKAQMGSSVNGVSNYGKIDNPINLVNEPHLSSGVNGVSIIGKFNHPTKSNFHTSPSTPYTHGEGVVCGRNIGGSLEKVVERRRKRMIKNRESAARSRARKQAYTLELEAEVAKLKQLNHELQKKQSIQEEIMETHNFQVPEKMKLSVNRKLCLRRTVTGPW